MADPVSIAVVYKLTNFSSLLEVSFGVNLIASMWEHLHKVGQNTCSTSMADYIERLAKQSADVGEDKINNISTALKSIHNSAITTGHRISKVGRVFGFISAALIFLILYFSGVQPDYYVTYNQVLIIFLTLALPVPLLLLRLKFHWLGHSKSLKSNYQHYNQVLFGEDDIAENAMKKAVKSAVDTAKKSVVK